MLMEEFGRSILVLFLIFLASVVVFLSIFLPCYLVYKKHRNFVEEHSEALKQLNEINKKYRFYDIKNYDVAHSYDNNDFYPGISCFDYLIYKLNYEQKQIISTLDNTYSNRLLNVRYEHELKEKIVLEKYDADPGNLNLERLNKIEKDLVDEAKQKPTLALSITVILRRTDINGSFKESKRQTFNEKEIENAINRIQNKRGTYFADEGVWQSICRVERGKVSNRMRFALLQRDHERCRMCGSRRDLEIDHIIPIAKGGKSTYDNLQVLCHRCNVKKGSKIY